MKKFTDESLRTIVAVDTNTFLDMVQTNENFVPKKGAKTGYYNTIRSLKRKCINGSLKIVILPQVWEEIKENLDNREKEFLQNYCLFLKPKDPAKYAAEVAKLAFSYVKTGVMNDKDKNEEIASDAVIMAQCSAAGINLITGNRRHFLFYEENDRRKRRKAVIRDRADDIQDINSRHGKYFEMKNGKSFIPRPYSPAEFFELYRDGEFYEQKEYEEIDLIHKEF